MIEISEYINVKERAKELECNVPTEVTVLPQNFETASSKNEFRYDFSHISVTKLMRMKKINETPLEKEGERRNTITHFSMESNFLDLPTLFFAAKFIGMAGCTILLNLISTHISNHLNKKDMHGDVELNIVTETKSGSYKQIHYKGPKDGLKEVPKVIRSVYDDS